MVMEKDCGHCMWHQPNSKCTMYTAPKITQGEGKGQQSWWLCKCKESGYFNKGRVSEDGKACQFFDNRYESEKKTEEWLNMCYADKGNKKKQEVFTRRRMYVKHKR